MDFLKNWLVFLVVYLEISDAGRRRPQKQPAEVSFAEASQQNWKPNRNFKGGFNHDPFSENCVHSMCSNVTNYPANYVRNMMSKQKDFHRFFGTVIQPYEMPTLAAKSPGSGNKENEERNMCRTVRYTYFPETAVNKQRKRMLIVNVNEFRQAVTFETCIANAKCFLEDHKPLGYETACKQQYNLIRLVSMTEDGIFTLDSFPIPSNCVCTYRRVTKYT